MTVFAKRRRPSAGLSAPIRYTAMALLAVGLAACAPSGPPKPAFYVDLSQPSARFDPVAAQGMINAFREREGLPPLALSGALNTLADAEARAVAQAAARTGRVRPTGTLRQKAGDAGFTTSATQRNVSAGYYTIAEAFSGWRESDIHRATMLSADATHMGIAAFNAPRVKYRVYWTLITAPRAGTSGSIGGSASGS